MSSSLKRLFLLLTWAALMLPAWAQPKLGVTSAWTLPADSIDYIGTAYTISIGVVFENVGNALLNGPVDIIMRYNSDTTGYVKAHVDLVDFEVGQQYQLSFFDTITNINGARYKGGDNILVIWPKADNSNVLPPDTGSVGLYINDLRLGDADREDILRTRVQVYPNPANTRIQLDLLKDASKFEYVRITDLSGKELYVSHVPVQEIPVTHFAAGTVLMHVKFRDGVSGAYKIHIQ